MKRYLLISSAIFIAFAFFAFSSRHETKPFDINEYKARNLVRCTPDWSYMDLVLNDADIPPMPGAGNYEWKIGTTNDSAQFYFNQGINMYYGFHTIEALASFKKAARFDPQDPMVWWGQSLAYGPNINDMGYTAPPQAFETAQKAAALKPKAGPAEQMLIDAISVRYSADNGQPRQKLNQAYADALYKAYQKFPKNSDVASLYAEALMLQHPWDYWFPNGRHRLWTPLIRSVLESSFTRNHDHPGANHYYIHIMEASPTPAAALDNADRLGKLSPGLSHVVHMPSHIYLRTGQYLKASQINEEAVNQYKRYSQLFPPVRENAFLYEIHNRHMQVNIGLLAGRYNYTRKAVTELQQSIDSSMLSLPAPMGSYAQYIYMTPVFVNTRFGKWQPLLDMPKPADEHVYANVLYHFGRGMALAGQNKGDDAQKELNDLRERMRDSILKIPVGPYSPPLEGAKVAEKLLEGFIALKGNKQNEAIALFEKAVQLEENMVYDEPRDWLLNPKQYLGSAYLAASRWDKAEEAFRRDMTVNDQNAWSMQGLLTALQKQNKTKDVKKLMEKLSKAVSSGELETVSVVF